MDERETERIMGQVAKDLELLRSVKVGEVPPDLLEGIRAMPAWLLAFAVARQWLVPVGAVAGAAAAVGLLLHVSNPLSATLAERGAGESRSQNVQGLTPGTTLLARTGQQVEMKVAEGKGTLRLQGPGALVVRKASVGKVRGDHRLRLDLPSGAVRIQFGPDAPPHSLLLSTPQAMIGLTGTDVLVETTPVTTRLQVFEGRATLRNLATGEAMVVTAGKSAEVKAGWMRVMEETAEPGKKPVWMEVE